MLVNNTVDQNLEMERALYMLQIGSQGTSNFKNIINSTFSLGFANKFYPTSYIKFNFWIIKYFYIHEFDTQISNNEITQYLL